MLFHFVQNHICSAFFNNRICFAIVYHPFCPQTHLQHLFRYSQSHCVYGSLELFFTNFYSYSVVIIDLIDMETQIATKTESEINNDQKHDWPFI